MKIAQVAPLMESVPPRFYGGTERIVSYLTEELVAQGHDVTLFASGDSITSAKLVPCCAQALRLNKAVRDPIPYYMLMLDKVRRQAHEFDIIHFHIDQFHFPDLPRHRPPHGHDPARPAGSAGHVSALRRLSGDAAGVDLQRPAQADPRLPPIAATIYHGLPRDLLTPTLKPRGGYLAFIGRISPEKRVDRAIRIARAVGIPLKIAAKVDRVDLEYFKTEIEPMLSWRRRRVHRRDRRAPQAELPR